MQASDFAPNVQSLVDQFEIEFKKIESLRNYQEAINLPDQRYAFCGAITFPNYMGEASDGTPQLLYTLSLNKLKSLQAEILAPEDKLREEMTAKIEKIEKIQAKFREVLVEALQNRPRSLLYQSTYSQMKAFTHIAECKCSPDLQRERSNDTRSLFTHRVVRAVVDHIPKKSITIGSIGSGRCFHELQIHASLKDYQVTWILMDKTYEDVCEKVTPKTHKSVTHFRALAEFIRPGTQVESYKDDVEYFSKPDANPDMILVIDVQENNQPFRDKVADLNARGHHCILGILGKTNNSIEIQTFSPQLLQPCG